MTQYRIVERTYPFGLYTTGYKPETRFYPQVWRRKFKWFWEFWKEDEYEWDDCYESEYGATSFKTFKEAEERIRYWKEGNTPTEKVVKEILK